MPIDLQALLGSIADEQVEGDAGGVSGSGNGGGGGAWGRLFERHPEGGGPFDGRDNALTALLGFFRAKSFHYDTALEIALWWNEKYCDPPLPASTVREKMGRGWVAWKEGGLDDESPAPQEKTIHVLTVRELLEIARSPEKQFKWIADGLIQEKGVTTLSGPSGAGKTWLALEFARHLTRADLDITEKWLDAYELPFRRVLYIDEENGVETMGKRIDQLGFKEENDRFRCISDSALKLDDAADRKTMLGLCKDHQTELVVFDSLVAFHSKDENKSTEMRRIGEWLRMFVLAGVSVLVLHHDKKGGDGTGAEQDKTRGSGDITAFSQTVLGLTQHERTGVFTVTKRKIRGAENDRKTISYCIVQDKHREGVRIDLGAAATRQADFAEQKRDEAMTTKIARYNAAVEHLTATGEPVTTRNIAMVSKMSLRDVGEVKKELEADGDA